jgi:hypothetical protein
VGFLLIPYLVAVFLTLAAAADFLLRRHSEWPSRGTAFAWIALVSLLVSQGAMIGLWGLTNHVWVTIVAALALLALSFILAQYTAGRFRSFASFAAAIMALLYGLMIAMFKAFEGVR